MAKILSHEWQKMDLRIKPAMQMVDAAVIAKLASFADALDLCQKYGGVMPIGSRLRAVV